MKADIYTIEMAQLESIARNFDAMDQDIKREEEAVRSAKESVAITGMRAMSIDDPVERLELLRKVQDLDESRKQMEAHASQKRQRYNEHLAKLKRLYDTLQQMPYELWTMDLEEYLAMDSSSDQKPQLEEEEDDQ
jgi:putative protein kinase ArgK-like GTPase of G3E family